jgi:O-antigen/teichoic acid export membrane protein
VNAGPAAEPPVRRSKGGAGKRLGARLTRDAALYTAGAFFGFVISLVNVAVLTRFLVPSEYGQLALLLMFSAGLTVLYNLGSLQGTFVWVFGASEDEEVDADQDQPSAADKRRALSTGFLVSLIISAIGTVLVFALAPGIAALLLGDGTEGNLIRIAALSGAAGAVWRLTVNVMRLERRPYGFVALNSARPILVVAMVVPLIASGHGAGGAMAGTAIGTAIAVAIALVVTRRSFEFAFGVRDLKMILRRGVIFVPIIACFWIAQNVDLFALSRYTTDAELGLYRLASRFGAFASYFSSALFMAYTPLVRTSAFAAVERARGKGVLGGDLLTYFVLSATLLILGMTVAADGLVRIAPPAYADAAPLIPILAGAFLAHGLLIAIYRVSSFPLRRTAYTASAIVSAAVFIAGAAFLIPLMGAPGAALAVTLGFLTGASGLIYLSQRGPTPLRIEYGRIVLGVALAAACLALARGVGSLAGRWQPAVELVALILYPVLLAVTGVVRRDEREALANMLRQLLPRNRGRAEIQEGLRRITPREYAGLELAVVYRWPVSELASMAATGIDESSADLVAALRSVSGLGGPTENDSRVGEYLFSDQPVAERDALARSLWSDHIDPEDLHVLEATLEGLQRLPRRAWNKTRRERGEVTQLELIG